MHERKGDKMTAVNILRNRVKGHKRAAEIEVGETRKIHQGIILALELAVKEIEEATAPDVGLRDQILAAWCEEGYPAYGFNKEAMMRAATIAATIATAQGSGGVDRASPQWGYLLTDDIGSYANAKLMWVRRFGKPSRNPVRFWRGGDNRVHTDLLGYTQVAAINDLDLNGYEFCEAVAPDFDSTPQPGAGEVEDLCRHFDAVKHSYGSTQVGTWASDDSPCLLKDAFAFAALEKAIAKLRAK